jgi:hypothetical protein
MARLTPAQVLESLLALDKMTRQSEMTRAAALAAKEKRRRDPVVCALLKAEGVTQMAMREQGYEMTPDGPRRLVKRSRGGQEGRERGPYAVKEIGRGGSKRRVELTAANVKDFFYWDDANCKLHRVIIEFEKRLKPGADINDRRVPYADKLMRVEVRRMGNAVGVLASTNNRKNAMYGHQTFTWRGEKLAVYEVVHLMRFGTWPENPPHYVDGDKWNHRVSNLVWR